jgi:probable phosphoglycerate mutase
MTSSDRSDSSVLWLIRHGRTASNVRMAVHCHANIPLDDVGREQARAAAEAMSRLPDHERPVRILASPLDRAMETARIIGARLGLEPVELPELIEIDLGEIDGFTADDLRGRPDLLELLAGEWLSAFAWPGGESLAAFHRRVAGAASAAVAGAAGPVALVTHGGVVSSLVGRLLGPSPDEWLLAQCGRFTEAIDEYAGHSRAWPERILNCSITKLTAAPDCAFPAGWDLLSWNRLPYDPPEPGSGDSTALTQSPSTGDHHDLAAASAS